MTQTTTALLCPEPDDNPLNLLCPPFCDDTCDDRNDPPGGLHHTSGFDSVEIFGGRCPVTLDVSASRSDDDGKAGDNVVNLLAFHDNFGTCMSAGQARQLAALLLNAADMADPLPQGVQSVPAGQVRIGDEISTPDGWQTVNGLLLFPDANQAALYTPERDDITSDGWQHGTYDPIKVRRRIHGSCANAFGEPIR